MNKFLRYNARHSLFFPRGFDGKVWPQLNPIMSSSHGKDRKKTWRFSEPLWVYQLRQRVFCFAGAQRCPSRADNGTSLPDSWDFGPDGNRTCSFCGSIHPEDALVIIEKSKTDDRYGMEGSTKSYKAYVRQPGVRNAGEGAIKYYGWHAPKA